jgi:hypothetical protein
MPFGHHHSSQVFFSLKAQLSTLMAKNRTDFNGYMMDYDEGDFIFDDNCIPSVIFSNLNPKT